MKKTLLFLTAVIFIFTFDVFAEDSYDRVKQGNGRISLFISSSAPGTVGGNSFSPSASYFVMDNVFIGGGLRFAQFTYKTPGTQDVTLKSNGVSAMIGGAIPVNKSIIFDISGSYSQSLDDFSSGGSTYAGTDFHAGEIDAILEFLLSSKMSLHLGLGFGSGTSTDKATNLSTDISGSGFNTGWSYYF
jgi:hypothetical protein